MANEALERIRREVEERIGQLKNSSDTRDDALSELRKISESLIDEIERLDKDTQVSEPPENTHPSTARLAYDGESGYLQLCRDVINFGAMTPDRSGYGRKKILFPTLTYDLREGFPAITVRKAPMKLAFLEIMAFMRGELNIREYLNSYGYGIWDLHTSREFLDKQGLHHIPEGHLGKSYGFQFTAFGGELDEHSRAVGGTNQIRRVFDGLKADPYGSRHLVSIWNPDQLHDMSLPPCWYGFQFVVVPNCQGIDTLNLKVTSRSSDLPFGYPFNVQQYAFVLTAFAKCLGMEAGVLQCSLADAHIYGNQIEYMKEIVEREIITKPSRLEIRKTLESIDDILSLTWEDIELHGFSHNANPVVTPKPALAE